MNIAGVQPFRNAVLFLVRDRFYELEIHNYDKPIDERPGYFYPIRPDENVNTISQDNRPERYQSSQVRNPNPVIERDGSRDAERYFTPTWQTMLRPPTPQDVEQQKLVPSVFLLPISGARSATGRGLQNSPIRASVNDITEDYTIRVYCPFRVDVGAWQEGTREPRMAKSISEQLNGFVHDVDRLISGFGVRPNRREQREYHPSDPIVPIVVENPQEDNYPAYNVVDAYLSDWNVLPALEGMPDEMFVGDIVVTINFARDI